MPLIRILLAACALAASGALWAQCGVTQTCTDPPTGIPGVPGIGLPGICKPSSCLNDAGKERYAREHNCKFPPGDACGELAINKATQCCTKDAQTGKPKIRNKQITVLDGEFSWETYTKECPGMRQSEAPPDGLWSECKKGEPHASDDEWPIVEVVSNPLNPKARKYCVDGCSTPKKYVHDLWVAGDFLFETKDNPTGQGPGGFGESSSFYGSCATHDKCYQTCDGKDQRTCDDELLKSMLSVCEAIPLRHVTPIIVMGVTVYKNTRDKCQRAANIMHTGLRLSIESARLPFKKRRQQYCQCC